MNTLTLSTGRVIPLADVRLDVPSQRFYYGIANVTDSLSGEQKRTFPGYDIERANREASDAARIASGEAPYADPSTAGTLTLFVDGVGDDLSTAAQDVRDFVGIGRENAGRRSPLFWTVLLVGLGYLAHQLGVFAWIRKKLTA